MRPRSEAKPWNTGRKPTAPLRPRRRILVLCEDTKSSVLYLKQFPVDERVVDLKIAGTGYNTDSLMEDAIIRKERAIGDGSPYSEIWVVFDRDTHTGFHRAFDLVKAHGDITACWSNECFELWYLLHFGLRETAIGRDDIYRELGRSDRLGGAYAKNDASIYTLLADKLEAAMGHASTVYARNAVAGTRRENPSTKVHQLIARLQSLSPEALG